MERWKPVVGSETFYEVSDIGIVRSLPRLVVRCDGRVRRVPGKVLSTSPTHGYPALPIRRPDGTKTTRRTCNLVAEAFIGPCPAGQQVRHRDGNRANSALTNLHYGTQSENERDKVAHGTHNNARKTHCPLDHELRRPNLVRSTLALTGGRNCLACCRGRANVRNALERHGLVLALRAEADRHYAEIMGVTTQ